MIRTWCYLGLFGLTCVTFQINSEAQQVSASSAVTQASKLSPAVLRTRWRARKLDLRVQLRPPARAKDYIALWEAGARVVGRDYARATADVSLPPRALSALAALPRVERVSLNPAPAAR